MKRNGELASLRKQIALEKAEERRKLEKQRLERELKDIRFRKTKLGKVAGALKDGTRVMGTGLKRLSKPPRKTTKKTFKKLSSRGQSMLDYRL